jgi:hypothetical protein
MNQFLTDFKSLIKNHWKVILLIIAILWLFSSYSDIKAGIVDGWSGE